MSCWIPPYFLHKIRSGDTSCTTCSPWQAREELLQTCFAERGLLSPSHDLQEASSPTKAGRQRGWCSRQASRIIFERERKISLFPFPLHNEILYTFFLQYYTMSPYTGMKPEIGFANKTYECGFSGEKLPHNFKICHDSKRLLACR